MFAVLVVLALVLALVLLVRRRLLLVLLLLVLLLLLGLLTTMIPHSVATPPTLKTGEGSIVYTFNSTVPVCERVAIEALRYINNETAVNTLEKGEGNSRHFEGLKGYLIEALFVACYCEYWCD
jgi:hypothetical protein